MLAGEGGDKRGQVGGQDGVHAAQQAVLPGADFDVEDGNFIFCREAEFAPRRIHQHGKPFAVARMAENRILRIAPPRVFRRHAVTPGNFFQ